MRSNKTLIGIIAGVLAVCILGVGVIALISSDKKGDDVTTTLAAEPVTDTNGNTVEPVTDAQGNTVSSSQAQSTTSAEDNLREKILGKWTDSANMSGYEFFADGKVIVTYVNLDIPFVNLPINGTANGTYTLEGDKLTTKFSIYTATIDDTFRASVKDNTLSLYDYDDFETATYTKVTSADPTSVQGNTTLVTPTGLEGAWVNSDQSRKYDFAADSTVYITVKNSDGSTTTYTGIYFKQDPSVIIQYTVGNDSVTENYSYTVSGNTLSLTDEDGSIYLFVRSGASATTPAGTGGLMGKWLDGAGISGYTFKEGGVVDVTYVNFTVPVINMPINGTFTGTYSVDGDKITISYSVYGKAMNENYTYTVTDMALTLTGTDGTVKSYVRQ